MTKFFRGTILKIATGAVQFIRNKNEEKDFLLVTGRHGNIYIPISVVRRALEDEWIADSMERGERK